MKFLDWHRYWMFIWFKIEERYGHLNWKITCTRCDFFLDCECFQTPYACPKCGQSEAGVLKRDNREHGFFGARLGAYLLQCIGYRSFTTDWRKEADGSVVYGATNWNVRTEAERNDFERCMGISFHTVVRWRDYMKQQRIGFSGFQNFRTMDDLPGLEAIFQATGFLDYDTEMRFDERWGDESNPQ